MRAVPLVTLVVLVVAMPFVPLPVQGLPAGLVITAAGVVEYSIVKDGIPPTCSGEGPFQVTYEGGLRQVLVEGMAAGCVPIWALISNCRLEDGGVVRCDKTVSGNRINITLDHDGRFDYLWHAPTFHEEMHGTMVRVG